MNKSDITNTFLELGCFPHQAEFAADFLATDSEQNHLLASLPGLGKGFVGHEIVGYSLSHGLVKKVLVLAPRVLTRQWCDVLQRNSMNVPCSFIDRRRLRELDAEEERELWMNAGVVVLSIDFARQADIADLLSHTTWDLIVVDEAHHLKSKNQRYKLIQRLFENSPKSRILLLHTLSQVTEGDRVENPLFPDAKVSVWSRETVKDKDGNPLLPVVQINWINYVRSDDEQRVLLELQACIRRAAVKEPRSQLQATALLQAASSSLLALEQSLCQIQRTRKESLHGFRNMTSEVDYVEVEPEAFGGDSDSQSLAKSSFIDEVPKLLSMLEHVETDSKLESLLSLLQTIGVSSCGDRRVCVITSYVNTATYLESALSEHYTNVTAITGSLPYEDRDKGITCFSQNGGVLVCTSAVSVSISEVAAVVLYDILWDPTTIDARIGQFIRVGQSSPVQVYAFEDDSSTLVFEKLQRKLDEIKESIGNDVLKSLLFLGEDEINKYLSNMETEE